MNSLKSIYTTKRVRMEPTINLSCAKKRSHKPTPEKKRKVRISGCKHKSTTTDDDFHIIACTSCGEVTENASSVPRSVRGSVTLLGGNVGLCTYEFIQGKRKGTMCKAYTRDRMTTRCHKHKPKKNMVEKVPGKCEHTFTHGTRKGTVCGANSREGINRCHKHKPKKNMVEKVDKCEHTFAYGIRKGTVCGVDTKKGANRCYKHKTKKT